MVLYSQVGHCCANSERVVICALRAIKFYEAHGFVASGKKQPALGAIQKKKYASKKCEEVTRFLLADSAGPIIKKSRQFGWKNPLKSCDFSGFLGRSAGIRTLGLLLPKQARYQLRNTPVDGRPGGGAIQGACADAGLAETIIMYEAGFCKRRKNLRAVFTGHGWFAIITHIDNGKGARENENAKKAEPGAADGAV